MATLQIEFRGGEFVAHNGINVTTAEPDHFEGNGWVGFVHEDGGITCYATRYYRGDKHQLKFKINKNGYAKKTLKINSGKPKVLKGYKIYGWPIDGVIGLSGGFIDERVVYFRTKEFQEFLDDYQLTAVRQDSANGMYKLETAKDGPKILFEETIQTDGRYSVVDDVVKNNPSTSGFEVKQKSVYVTGASWVIKTVKKHGEIQHRILVTLDNPKEIMNLPKLQG